MTAATHSADAGETSWRERLLSARSWTDVAHNFRHDWQMLYKEIAVGFLLTALHTEGLSALTHAPSPMGFLREILERPENERPFLLIPVGYPAEGATYPDLRRKPLDEFAVFI